MVRPVITVHLNGPFFQRDPGKTFREDARRFMDRVAEITEAEVRHRMEGGGPEADATAPFVQGRTRSLSGRRWACTARVSVSTAGLSPAMAVRRQAIAAGRHTEVTFEGRCVGRTRGAEGRTHAFRDGRRAVGDAAKENASKLTEGLI